ncbi:Hypothetical protein PACV_292 [Pacmanvirus A23]|uniref:Hypothetical protein n=1 Tax=Pacmanvirus A23 TaxID=1932881 RepID=UPI000A091FE6|nr:Hypothetical protein B9W72_gp288 [Pacmanvirus A23]SIP86005.1 Hypothetical protein PACV_292 [Pacmanvirus A23]
MYFVLSCLIILVIILVFYYNKEHMTKIRRGVGFLNTGDEIPIASGIIHSAPIFDLTHTYFDGRENVSCDECPNYIVCPQCPQYKTQKEQFCPQNTQNTQCMQKINNFNTAKIGYIKAGNIIDDINSRKVICMNDYADADKRPEIIAAVNDTRIY